MSNIVDIDLDHVIITQLKCNLEDFIADSWLSIGLDCFEVFILSKLVFN